MVELSETNQGNLEELRKSKMKSNDRVFILAPMEGKKVLDVTGNFDKTLFTSDNKLHAIIGSDGLWYMRYEKGVVPGSFKTKFTKFDNLYKFVEDYYKRRNVQIKAVMM